MSDVPNAKRQAETLSRKSIIWGVIHATVAVALIIYAFATGGDFSWYILSGLVVAAAAGGLYFVAGQSLKGSVRTGRGRIILASVLALNWLAVVSCLALFSSIMHPDTAFSSGIANLLIGLLIPLGHLIGNIWFLVAGLNLDTGAGPRA